MAAAQFLKARVSFEEKERVRAIAKQQLITESVWLRRLVMASLSKPSSSDRAEPTASGSAEAASRATRLYVRLRREDRLLLTARAAARGMRPATYVSVLTRSHLRSLPPLPKEELLALKRSVSELGAIGRNLNQLARIANQTGRATGPGQENLVALLKVCGGLRDHTKGLIKANIVSWKHGHAEADH